MGRARLDHERIGRPHHAAPKSLFAAADLVTGIRLPLAAAFPFVDGWDWRLAIVLVAGVSDVLDGAIARRFGSSKLGAVLDPRERRWTSPLRYNYRRQTPPQLGLPWINLEGSQGLPAGLIGTDPLVWANTLPSGGDRLLLEARSRGASCLQRGYQRYARHL